MQFNKTERMNGERASNESTNGKSLRRNGMPENFVRLHTNTVTDVRDVNTERERESKRNPRIFYYMNFGLFFLVLCCLFRDIDIFCATSTKQQKAFKMTETAAMVATTKHENEQMLSTH